MAGWVCHTGNAKISQIQGLILAEVKVNTVFTSFKDVILQFFFSQFTQFSIISFLSVFVYIYILLSSAGLPVVCSACRQLLSS